MKTLFVNSGMLGHRAVAELIRDAARTMPSVAASHIDLSCDLTLADRAWRRLLGVGLAPTQGPAANLDLRRWRLELNAGLLAARRIADAERLGGPFDALHFHTQATAYASIARMKRTPTIVSIDATQRLASREMTSTLARLSYQPNIVHDRAVFDAAAAIVSTSDWAARDLADAYPECARKVHVMPYPVRVRGDASWIDERRERARDSRHQVRVLFMGGDFPRKGGFELLKAWRDGAFFDRASLDLVTDWALGPGDLPPGVRVISHVTPYSVAWLELWRGADLFVMPTRHEAFGMVFQEAAAAGLPVVASRINAVPEIVQDGRTGLLVQPNDAGALIRAMTALVDSPDLRATMGERSRRRILSISSPERYAAGLANLLDSVVGTHASV